MAITGKIVDFFLDKTKSIVGFPRTKIKAISDDNNVSLDVLLGNINTSIDNAMPKSGGTFTGVVTLTNTANHIYQLSDTVSVLVGHSNGEFVISTNNNGIWNELFRLNQDGSIKASQFAKDSDLAGCWISFTDENGTATDEPYIHWEE